MHKKEINDNPEYEEFCDSLLKMEYEFHDCYNRVFLTPETYEPLLQRLSYLRKNKLIDSHHRSLFYILLDNGRKRYKDFLIKKSNIPRKEAQKFIGNKKVREFIFSRDNYECLCCGSKEKLSIDHIKSVNECGENNIENLQTLCSSCNSRKGSAYIDFRK